MIKTLINAWKLPEVRKKILYTLLLIVIFRIGCVIPIPGIDSVQLSQYVASNSNSLLGTLNIISGGALSRLTIFALSISPYITASIVIQLLTIAIPALERLSKEGEEGKKRINKYMKYLTVVLAVIEAFGLYMTYKGSGIYLIENTALMLPIFILSLVGGTAFLTWLGDQISAKGIGNGISMLIFVGIVSRLPQAGLMLYSLVLDGMGAFYFPGLLQALGVVIGAVVLLGATVWVQEAERRIPVQYAKKVVGRKMYGGQNTHIPLKLVMAGVIPVILAMSLITLPVMILNFVNPTIVSNPVLATGFSKVLLFTAQPSILINSLTSQGLSILGGVGYVIAHSIIYLLLIVGFTFFYTMITFNPVEVSNNLKKNGGFIPGIRPGRPTIDYMKGILNKLTWFGAFFLGVIAIIPVLFQLTGLSVSFGGTAVLIVAGVALETVRQLESNMVMRHYKGFLD